MKLVRTFSTLTFSGLRNSFPLIHHLPHGLSAFLSLLTASLIWSKDWWTITHILFFELANVGVDDLLFWGIRGDRRSGLVHGVMGVNFGPRGWERMMKRNRQKIGQKCWRSSIILLGMTGSSSWSVSYPSDSFESTTMTILLICRWWLSGNMAQNWDYDVARLELGRVFTLAACAAPASYSSLGLWRCILWVPRSFGYEFKLTVTHSFIHAFLPFTSPCRPVSIRWSLLPCSQRAKYVGIRFHLVQARWHGWRMGMSREQLLRTDVVL